MRILGRQPSSVLAALWRLPSYAADVRESVRVFKRPLDVLRCYLLRRNPASGMVETRSGLRIVLSSDPADIVTVFTIFARHDYGSVPAKSTIIDVGANIGVFALYAIECGAATVVAFEPSAESYERLLRNIEENQLHGRIIPHRAAVTAIDGGVVRFPRRSSVMNAIGTAASADCDDVPTMSLGTALAAVGHADLVKLDCEGGEYEILFTLPPAAFAKIGELRLEYHHGREDEIRATMSSHGFRETFLTADNAIGGVLWFARA